MQPIRLEPTATRPKAHFSLWDTVCIIVGIIIGAGIFKTPGSVFALFSNPLQALGIWILGGLLCLVGSYCFAELGSTYPRSGGDYVYLTNAFGSWAGFLFAWGQLLIVRTAAGIVPLAYVFAEFMLKLLNLDEETSYYTLLYTLLSLGSIVLLTIINLVGVRFGKWTQNGLTVVKVLGLTMVLAAGFIWGVGGSGDALVYEGTVSRADENAVTLRGASKYEEKTFQLTADSKLTVDGSNQIDDKPVRPADLLNKQAKVVVFPEGKLQVKATTHSSWEALALALILILFTYSGWNEGAYIAAEVNDSRRNLPRALLLGTVIVIILYVLVNAAYIWGLGFERAADSPTVAADVLKRVPGGVGESAICLLVMVSALGSINGTLCTNSRIFAEFGDDHSLFAPLGRWSPRFGTPVTALIVQMLICLATIAVIACVLGSFQTFDRLIDGTAPVFWLFFLGAGATVIVLRRKDRTIDRPFKVPLYPLTPLLFCGACLLMVIGSAMAKPWDAAAWIGILLLGIPLYWLTLLRPRAVTNAEPAEAGTPTPAAESPGANQS